MTHDHDDHSHQHGSELSEMQLRLRALETVLAEKGYVDQQYYVVEPGRQRRRYR